MNGAESPELTAAGSESASPDNPEHAESPPAYGSGAQMSPGAPKPGWFTRFTAGYVFQGKAGFKESDGEFDVNRFISRASVGYMPDYSRSISFSAGYDREVYGFSGPTDLSGSDPWENINTVRFGVPVRWGLNERWTLFVIPTARWNAEDGADWGEALSGGGFAGFSYKFSEKLTIGPGFGAITQLEDTPSYFPVIIVDWSITEKLKLETGRGLGASQGPGLMLSYVFDESWTLSAGGRYEKFRFRLNETGATPNGIGEDKGVPVYVGVRYRWSPKGSVTLLGGVDLSGELELSNALGETIASSDYDPAPFVGLSIDLRF